MKKNWKKTCIKNARKQRFLRENFTQICVKNVQKPLWVCNSTFKKDSSIREVEELVAMTKKQLVMHEDLMTLIAPCCAMYNWVNLPAEMWDSIILSLQKDGTKNSLYHKSNRMYPDHPYGDFRILIW